MKLQERSRIISRMATMAQDSQTTNIDASKRAASISKAGIKGVVSRTLPFMVVSTETAPQPQEQYMVPSPSAHAHHDSPSPKPSSHQQANISKSCLRAMGICPPAPMLPVPPSIAASCRLGAPPGEAF